jgi:hypothetical protein
MLERMSYANTVASYLSKTRANLRLRFAIMELGFFPGATCLVVSPFESNALELSNTLLCHGTWLSFLMQLILSALSGNPPPELRVGRILVWHEAVTEMHLECEQLLKTYPPNRTCPISLASPPVESNTLELSNTLLCHRT